MIGKPSSESHLNLLLKQFVESVEGTVNENPRIVNKFAKQIDRIYRELKTTEPGKNKLRTLLSHANTRVQLWAARLCIFWFPAEAKAALKKVMNNDPVLDFEARIILDEFENGQLSNG